MKDNSSIFMEVIGISDESMVLDYMMLWRDFPFSLKDIKFSLHADGNKLKSGRIIKVVNKFLKNKFLIRTKKGMLKVNCNNKIVFASIVLFDTVLKHNLTEDCKKIIK